MLEDTFTEITRNGKTAWVLQEDTEAIADAVSIPVIASGGAGSMEHFRYALVEGKADAALAASLFHYNELRIGDLKQYLHEKGVPMRLTGWENLDAD